MITRRQGLLGTGAWWASHHARADDQRVRRGRALRFPRDHGAHLASRVEWWYATGWLLPEASSQALGFQVTFFRSSTGLAADLPGRLAPRHLLFAHAALTDPAGGTHQHADRAARWSGNMLPDLRARASQDDADVSLGGWFFRRSGPVESSRYDTQVAAAGFRLDLQLQCTQALLLQGDAGFSRKGPDEAQASHYTSETQVKVAGRVTLGSRELRVRDGRAWIDHEWSDELLHPQAVGWDWIGINLDDGRSLMAFQLRKADGSVLWAGGSLRRADGTSITFQPHELQWTAGRRWRSPATHASYPVEWQLTTPVGRWQVSSLLDAQELDSRNSTGTVYWEGLADLRDATGQQRLGRGYLEMTGYAGRLVL
jgi:predicted secreted hydrolase